jgi:hypothetical protein
MVGPQWVNRKRRLRAYANAHGIAIPKAFRITPTCGKACRELIRRIEVRTWGPTAGTGKWSARLGTLVTPKLTRGQKALNVARTQLGVCEHPAGSNRGPQVDQYLAACGLGGQAQPWCAAFVTWCLAHSGTHVAGFNTAYVPSWVQAARAGRNGLSLVPTGMVRPGDLVAYDWQSDGTADHIGIVEKAPAGGQFVAIEGNTSAGNNSNGGQVQRRDRSLSEVAAFIRVS